jgi:hypothetical protein
LLWRVKEAEMTDTELLGLMTALQTAVTLAVWVQTVRLGRQDEKIFTVSQTTLDAVAEQLRRAR